MRSIESGKWKRRKRNLSGKVVLESKSKVMLPSFLPAFLWFRRVRRLFLLLTIFQKVLLTRGREKVLVSLLSIARESEDGGRKWEGERKKVFPSNVPQLDEEERLRKRKEGRKKDPWKSLFFSFLPFLLSFTIGRKSPRFLVFPRVLVPLLFFFSRATEQKVPVNRKGDGKGLNPLSSRCCVFFSSLLFTLSTLLIFFFLNSYFLLPQLLFSPSFFLHSP